MSLRIGYLTTHPIQYQTPIFRLLAARPDVDFTALYCLLPNGHQQSDGFNVRFEWDIPLLDGHDFEVLRNVAARPGVSSFGGCDTPDVYDVVRRRRFDALVVNGWQVKSCLQALRAARRAGIPCLVRGEANLLRPRPWWKRVLHGRLLSRYSACLYIGKRNREFYERHGVSPSRLFPALYCIDNDRFSSEAAAWSSRPAECRQHFGIDSDKVCFLFSGKLIEKKHPLELLHAFRGVAQSLERVHLLVVGDGELRASCQQYAEQHHLPVTFAGFLNQSEIAQAYTTADCLVLPSDHGETWGLVVNEAMACGRAAIVSDQVGCAADLIAGHGTGGVFPFGDWQRLAAQMLELAADRPRLAAMGIAAKRHIASYSPAAAADGIVRAVLSAG